MSRWLFMFERQLAWGRGRRWAIALLVGLLVLYWMDGTLYRWVYVGAGAGGEAARQAREQFEARSWAAMLKGAGYWPVWLVVGAVLGAAARAAAGARVAGAAALGGLFAEAIKPVVGQIRPHLVGGAHRYWSAADVPAGELSYGMASSHAAVAFGAAWMLVFLYGRPGWVVLALAAGCGVERMMAGAHFATDVYVAGVLGYAGSRLVRPGGWAGQREGLMLP